MRKYIRTESRDSAFLEAIMMTLQLLGGFRLTGSDGTLNVPLSSARVLAFLGLRQRPVGRATVATDLWPEAESRRALGNLRSAIWRLPAAARVAIEATDDSVSLSSEVNCVIEPGINETKAFETTALQSWGAALLPGWYDDWVLAERERLALRQAEFFEELSNVAREGRRTGDAVLFAVASIRLEPLRESAHRALLHAQREQGNYAEMLAQYQALSALLSEELGVQPSRSTTDLLSAVGLLRRDGETPTIDVWANGLR
jgi:DNA-binding SARP family transcriptional activator